MCMTCSTKFSMALQTEILSTVGPKSRFSQTSIFLKSFNSAFFVFRTGFAKQVCRLLIIVFSSTLYINNPIKVCFLVQPKIPNISNINCNVYQSANIHRLV